MYSERFQNKDLVGYSYDQMGNRTGEFLGRINKRGNTNIFREFGYSTNELNQYLDRYIVDNSSTPVGLDDGNIIDLNPLIIGNGIIGDVEDTDNSQDEEELVELNGKLIYDKNGNMIGNMLNNKRQYIYSYDYKNRLVKVEKTVYKNIEGTETNEVQEIVKIIQYRYDNLDRRIQKIFNNGSIINYYYSNKDIILEENFTKINNNGNRRLKTSKYYINGNSIDDVLVMEFVEHKTRRIQEEFVNNRGVTRTRNINETYTETNLYYYHKNHLGSIVAITNNLGNILEEYEYDVFGKPYSKDIVTGKVTNLKKSVIGNTRLFTGREYERGLQLYYNRARYYNPELGRFISRDPIDISDDVNLYAYVGNSPISFTDPMGTEKKMTSPPKTATEHYARNALNIDLPLTKDEILRDKNWKLLSNSASIFHSFGTPMFKFNSKFIHSDGREAVYDYKTGNLVTDDKNMGTYNYYLPDDKIDHFIYDIIPYIKWGNSENDNTNMTERIIQNKELLIAYNVDVYNSLLELSKKTSDNINSAKRNINSFNENDFIYNFNNYIKYR